MCADGQPKRKRKTRENQEPSETSIEYIQQVLLRRKELMDIYGFGSLKRAERKLLEQLLRAPKMDELEKYLQVEAEIKKLSDQIAFCDDQCAVLPKSIDFLVVNISMQDGHHPSSRCPCGPDILLYVNGEVVVHK